VGFSFFALGFSWDELFYYIDKSLKLSYNSDNSFSYLKQLFELFSDKIEPETILLTTSTNFKESWNFAFEEVLEPIPFTLQTGNRALPT
jgi:hypothetical protein